MRGKLKSLFFAMKLHYLLPAHIFSFLGSLSKLSKWISLHKKEGRSDFYKFKFEYTKREDLFCQVIRTEGLHEPIDYLEFGVCEGHSIKWWARKAINEYSRFYGFDTFEGLPENWGPYKKGDMRGEFPVTNDKRVRFYKGLFQDTLLPFLRIVNHDRRKVIHMDADLYSATLYVLSALTPYLKPGDIIFFDEFNVPEHEFRAFDDWVRAFYINYEVLGSVNNFYQTAIKLR